jgi:hypothetical protein
VTSPNTNKEALKKDSPEIEEPKKKRIIFLDLPTMSLNLSCGQTNNNFLANL